MFSNVWSENTALLERLMEIHSNSPKLYYGFKMITDSYNIKIQACKRGDSVHKCTCTSEICMEEWYCYSAHENANQICHL